MPRSKAPAILQAADRYRRAEERVVQCAKALEKARAARTDAEAAYLQLMAESLAARQLLPVRTGEEVTTTATA